MARKVKWARSAQKDLEQVAEFVSRDSERRAAQIVHKSLHAARSLTRFADRGRMVPEFSDPSIRELLKGSYRIIYKISDMSAVVVAFIHGARDLPALWMKRARQNGEEE